MESLAKRIEKLERLIEPKPEVRITYRVINSDQTEIGRMEYDPRTGKLTMEDAYQYDRQI